MAKYQYYYRHVLNCLEKAERYRERTELQKQVAGAVDGIMEMFVDKRAADNVIQGFIDEAVFGFMVTRGFLSEIETARGTKYAFIGSELR